MRRYEGSSRVSRWNPRKGKGTSIRKEKLLHRSGVIEEAASDVEVEECFRAKREAQPHAKARAARQIAIVIGLLIRRFTPAVDSLVHVRTLDSIKKSPR